MRKAKVIKPIRKPIVTKAAIQAQLKQKDDELAWGAKIIKMQQVEVDRLMKQVETLTGIVDRLSRKDYD